MEVDNTPGWVNLGRNGMARQLRRRAASCIAGGAQWGADMARTVADQFADILAAAGVKRIYGVVGDSLNGLTDALRRQGKIEWIPCPARGGGGLRGGGRSASDG